jgi:hypothetical protein
MGLPVGRFAQPREQRGRERARRREPTHGRARAADHEGLDRDELIVDESHAHLGVAARDGRGGDDRVEVLDRVGRGRAIDEPAVDERRAIAQDLHRRCDEEPIDAALLGALDVDARGALRFLAGVLGELFPVWPARLARGVLRALLHPVGEAVVLGERAHRRRELVRLLIDGRGKLLDLQAEILTAQRRRPILQVVATHQVGDQQGGARQRTESEQYPSPIEHGGDTIAQRHESGAPRANQRLWAILEQCDIIVLSVKTQGRSMFHAPSCHWYAQHNPV